MAASKMRTGQDMRVMMEEHFVSSRGGWRAGRQGPRRQGPPLLIQVGARGAATLLEGT